MGVEVCFGRSGHFELFICSFISVVVQVKFPLKSPYTQSMFTASWCEEYILQILCIWGKPLKKLKLWTLPLKKFLASGEKKILAREITDEHLGNNINQ